MTLPTTTFRHEPSFSIPPTLSDPSSLVWAPRRACFSHCCLLLKASRAALSPMFSTWPGKQTLNTSYYFLKHCSFSRNFCSPGLEKVAWGNNNKKKSVNLLSKKASRWRLSHASRMTRTDCCTNDCSCTSYFQKIIISEWNLILPLQATVGSHRDFSSSLPFLTPPCQTICTRKSVNSSRYDTFHK